MIRDRPEGFHCGAGTIFTGVLAPYATMVSFQPGSTSIAAADLAEPAVFALLIDRFQARHGGADRQAVVSFWSQYYFATLLIPAVALAVSRGHGLPLGLGETRITFCPDSGVPLVFHMDPAATSVEPPYAALVEDHVAPMIAILRRQSGLSARLFWENAGSYLVWVLETVGSLDPVYRDRARTWLADDRWPAAQCGSLGAMKRAALAGEANVRRVCCLRFQLPGFAYCEGICPKLASCRAAKSAKRKADTSDLQPTNE